MTEEILKRRTFAIVSHPDAGKTTITEKFLWFGKVIREAGHVRAKANKKFTTSDWMKIAKPSRVSCASPWRMHGRHTSSLSWPVCPPVAGLTRRTTSSRRFSSRTKAGNPRTAANSALQRTSARQLLSYLRVPGAGRSR